MPQTIVFDTNYLRTFGPKEFLSGNVPAKLRDQIGQAVARGDLVALLETVRMETNAWLKGEHEKKQSEIKIAFDRLVAAGYTVVPEGVQDKAPPDILPIMQMVNDKCCSISPQIQDYKEAEFRTSYREAPHPKNPEGEEMRDRLIWCQSLRLSKETGNPVLIVSADTIFRNGALSDEGKDARISVVESAGDFDQRLGERPQHISTLIQSLLTFSPELAKKGVDLSEENVRGIEELRKILNSDGSITQRFFLLISNATGVESRYSATMNSVGDQPLSIDLETNPPISIHRNLSEQELLELEGRRLQSFRGDAISSLRRLIGSS